MLLVASGVGVAAAASCSGNPQTQDEVAVVYRASFKAEQGVQTEVVFPFPADALADGIASGLEVTDGGTATVKDTPEGRGLSLIGHGDITASFSSARMKGLGTSTGIPDAGLTREVTDAGVSTYWFKVNKGGSPLATVDFEYQLKKDCGPSCGAKRDWSYAGPVGLALQQVVLNYTETGP